VFIQGREPSGAAAYNPCPDAKRAITPDTIRVARMAFFDFTHHLQFINGNS
jgi:hypothetical protein